MDYIKRSEAIRIIKSGETFTIEFVKCDQKRGLAGELVECRNWQLAKKAAQTMQGTRPAGTSRTVNPGHDEWETVNICNPATVHHIIKVHTKLILTLNGKHILNG